MADELDEFGERVGAALRGHTHATLVERHPDDVVRRSVTLRRSRPGSSWLLAVGGAALTFALVGAVVLARGGPQAPGGVGTTDSGNAASAVVDATPEVAIAPPWWDEDMILRAATVTVDGVQYRVAAARDLRQLDRLVLVPNAEVSVLQSGIVDPSLVYRFPNVPTNAALVMRAPEGAHDDLGTYQYVLLLGPDRPPLALCEYLANAIAGCN